jgi:hypothetical protein
MFHTNHMFPQAVRAWGQQGRQGLKRFVFVLLACAGVAESAQGQVWNESGDAPELLPGQTTVGGGPLTTITGDLTRSSTPDFVDAYSIYIFDPGIFRASTRNAVTASGVNDTQLFLFAQNGMGVTMDDDDPAGGSPQSVITGTFVPGPGFYVLAISGYNSDPYGGTTNMWNDTPFAVERAPDGPGAFYPLTAWGHDVSASFGAYQIDLQGASFAQAPAPGAAVALGLGGLLVSRRRR